jgi:hypothetical protein
LCASFQFTNSIQSDARAMPQQSKDHSSDDLIYGGESDAASAHAENLDQTLQQQILSDDLIVQILARLDGQSYTKALQQDARVRVRIDAQ